MFMLKKSGPRVAVSRRLRIQSECPSGVPIAGIASMLEEIWPFEKTHFCQMASDAVNSVAHAFTIGPLLPTAYR